MVASSLVFQRPIGILAVAFNVKTKIRGPDLRHLEDQRDDVHRARASLHAHAAADKLLDAHRARLVVVEESEQLLSKVLGILRDNLTTDNLSSSSSSSKSRGG